MKDGVLQQCDKPRVLYDSPVNAFVAGFIGSPAMNLLEGRIVENGVAIGSAVLPLPPDVKKQAAATTVTVGLRPESLTVNTDANGGIPAIVNLVEELGAEAYVYAQLAHDARIIAPPDIIARVDPDAAPSSGASIQLHAKEGSMLFFDAHTGARISASGTVAEHAGGE
jgi:multiple sugar transport system ATP-binding protein